MYETDVTFLLKLILQAQSEDVVFPVLLVSAYKITRFVKVEFIISLYADVLIETINRSDTDCALCQIYLGGKTVFPSDFVVFHSGIGVVGIIFYDGRKWRIPDVLYQVEKITDEFENFTKNAIRKNSRLPRRQNLKNVYRH